MIRELDLGDTMELRGTGNVVEDKGGRVTSDEVVIVVVTNTPCPDGQTNRE